MEKKKKDTQKKIDIKKMLPFDIKYLYIGLGAVLLVVILFLAFHKSDEQKLVELREDALSIGEKKYLAFLWMIDGAFNDERYKDSIFVNDKTISDEEKVFTCKYEDKDTCVGSNFENAFRKVFSNTLSYKDVYGDGLAFNWYEKLDNKYYFSNSNSGTCNISRMSNKQKLEVVEATKYKITYKITYTETIDKGIYKGSHEYTKDFVLVYEDDDWKVSKAYYHDPCYVDYNIGK